MNQRDQLSFQTKDWKPIPRIARVVPFGYVVSEEDPDLLLPVVLELEALEKAKIHLKQYSYRDVALWLKETTGRSISHEGLKRRILSERDRRKKASALREWARRVEKAKAKAEALESNYLGAGDIKPENV